MKRILAVGLASLFALPILSTVSIVAYAESTTSSTGSSSDSTAAAATPTTTSTDDTKPETLSADDTKALASRLAARKAELKTKLTSVEKTRVQSRCKASQGKISSVKGVVKGIETSRGEVYTNLTTRLTELSTKLKAKGADTAALDTAITDLKTKIATFNTDLTAYKQAVTDLSNMDCATDPDGFKASLETARTDLKKVNDDAAAVRAELTTTIKPLLQTIRTQLEKTESTSDDKTKKTDTTTNSTTSGTPASNTTTTTKPASGGNQ